MAGPYSGPGFVRVRGVVVLQASKIEFKFNPNNKSVMTLMLERAGHSTGPKEVEVSVENAIPQAGMEVDWFGLSAAGQEIALDFVLAGKTYACRGDLRDVSASTDVGSPNGVNWSFSGKWMNPTAGA